MRGTPAGSMLTNNTYFLKSDPDTTITSPGNSYHSLTVTAYDQRVGKIIQASGRGYTRNGHIKPDLALPGYRVPCALPQNRYGNTTALSGFGVCRSNRDDFRMVGCQRKLYVDYGK